MADHADFMDMLGDDIFNTSQKVHKMAILKRAVVIIAGENAVYVRMSHEQETQRISVYDTRRTFWRVTTSLISSK